MPPVPPLIVPLLVSVVIAPELAIPAPPAPPGVALEPKALSPRIVPLLVSVVIVPEFQTPVPPPALPPLIAPLLVRVVIAPAFQTPAPPAPPTKSVAPPRAADRPDSGVAERDDRRAFCVRQACAAHAADAGAGPATTAADRPAVGQRRDRAGVRQPLRRPRL